MIFTSFIMLSKNSNKKKVHQVLTLTILSLSEASLILTTPALDYAGAQLSDSHNTTAGMNITSPTTTIGGENQSTTAEVRTLIEQARMALQNNEIQSALMKLNSALDALEGGGGGGGEQSNNTATTPNEITDGTTTTTTATEAGTIGSGGAGGAGTAGGIMTGGGT
jgi:hypothetical protein